MSKIEQTSDNPQTGNSSLGVVSSSAYLCEIQLGTQSWKTVILAENETDIHIKAAEQYGNVRCEVIDVYDWL